MKNECSAFAISCRKHDHVHDSVGLLNGNTPDSLILAHAPSSAKLFNKQDLANSFLLAFLGQIREIANEIAIDTGASIT